MKRLEIGRLGTYELRPGFYAYVGSAFGSGGLRARVEHHLEATAEPHWHIDYLRRVARVRAIAYLVQPESPPAEPLECLWSQALVRLPGNSVPQPGFGASDCSRGCPAHLIAFPGDEQDGFPLLHRSIWLGALERAAGARLVTSPSPA